MLRRALLLGILSALIVAVFGLYPQSTPPGWEGGWASAGACPPVAVTPYFTIAFGSVLLDGSAAPVGTVVEAVSSRGDVAGCYEVTDRGDYGAMFIYGEDSSIDPHIPGMRDGEEVLFRVGGAEATASPPLLWENDWQSGSHEVNLEAALPPMAVSDLTAEPLGSHLFLTWSPVTANTAGQSISGVTYRLYRAANDAYFTPGGAPHVIQAGTSYIDPNALADPEINYFYIVTAVDGAGSESVPSNRAGAYHVALRLGWNLVSWPLAPHSTSLADILVPLGGACDGAWAYDAWDDADPWSQWPGGLADTDETMGIWLHLTEPAILPVTGRQPVSTTVDLRAGWNLVGYPAQTARPVSEALSSIAGCYTQVQTWDTTEPGDPWKQYDPSLPAYVNDLALMEPGRGYWIHAAAPCTLSIIP